jgi:RNA polymerase sigma-70 factor, ECF subfamily
VEIAELHRLGQAAWPTVELPPDAFAAYLATRDGTAARAPDLYIACACARGDAAAIQRFEEAYFDEVRAIVTRLAGDPALADEALQQLRAKLFVADARERGIANYAGRGDLRGWFKVAATRVTLTLLRTRRKAEDMSALGNVAAPEPDPELAVMRERYAADANDAIREAFGELEPRERNLLRQYYTDGLGIDALGKLYGVHRATAARWLDHARTKLEKRVRAVLVKRLGVTTATADSILALVRSDLHITLSSQ